MVLRGVLYNDGNHTFVNLSRTRGGLGPFGDDSSSGGHGVLSLNQPVALAAGPFTADTHNDLVVLNRGAHSFSLLVNDGNGNYLDPSAALTTSTSDSSKVNDRPGVSAAVGCEGDTKRAARTAAARAAASAFLSINPSAYFRAARRSVYSWAASPMQQGPALECGLPLGPSRDPRRNSRGDLPLGPSRPGVRHMSDVTPILSAIEQGVPHAAEQLLPLVYEELRRLAAQR